MIKEGLKKLAQKIKSSVFTNQILNFCLETA